MKKKFLSDKTMSGDSWKEIESWGKPGGKERMRKYGAKQDLATMKKRPAPKAGDIDYDSFRNKMLDLQSAATGQDRQKLLRNQEYMAEAREQYKNRLGYSQHQDFNTWLERQKKHQISSAMIRSNNSLSGRKTLAPVQKWF